MRALLAETARRFDAMPRRDRKPFLAVLGPPSSGKTRLLERLCASIVTLSQPPTLRCIDLRHIPLGTNDEMFQAVIRQLASAEEYGNNRVPVRFDLAVRKLLATSPRPLVLMFDHFDSVPRFFARSLARDFRSIYEERYTHLEYRRLGVVVAGALSIFDLKKEADSAFETFDTLFLPRSEVDLRVELVREYIAERNIVGLSDGVVDVLASETAGERAFLDPVLHVLNSLPGPVSARSVRDAVYVVAGEKATLPELSHLALRVSLDGSHFDVLEDLTQGRAVRPRDATADIDRFQLLGGVVLDKSMFPPVYQFRNAMVRRYMTQTLPIIRRYCAISGGFAATGRVTTEDRAQAMAQWPGLESAMQVAICAQRVAAATDIWTCARALADAWSPSTPYDGTPDLRFCVTQHDSQAVWWLNADGTTVKVARYRQRESWERALHGALATRRTYFASSGDELSVGAPLQVDGAAIVAVTTIARAQVNGPLSEASLGHWLEFLQLAASTVARLALAAIAQHAVKTPPFCSGETANQALWSGADASPYATIFMVMPFAPPFTKVQRAIERAAAALKLSVMRGDDVFGTNVVMSDVWHAILKADVVIADLSQRNPNVFYEVGLCHVTDKRVILLAQKDTDIPFDVAHWRHIKYTPNAPGLELLERTITKTLKSLGFGPAERER